MEACHRLLKINLNWIKFKITNKHFNAQKLLDDQWTKKRGMNDQMNRDVPLGSMIRKRSAIILVNNSTTGADNGGTRIFA